MHVGLCTISNREASVETVLDHAAQAGYDGVELWGKDHVGDGSAETCRAIGSEAAERGLDVPVYGSYLRAGTASFEDELDRELAVAEELGADLIRVWAGEQEYGDHDEDHWNQVVEDLSRGARAAAGRGLDVTVEKHAGTLTNAQRGARQLVAAVDSPHLGLNWQPSFSLTPADLVEEADALAPVSNNVHLLATAQRGCRTYSPLANAFFDVEAVLQPFLESGFDGYANVEFVPDDREYPVAIREERKYLRALLD